MEHEDKPYLFENNNILGRLKAVAPNHIFTGPIRVMAQRLGITAQSWHDWSRPGHSLTQKNIERLKDLMGGWGLRREIQEWVIHEKNGRSFDKANKLRTRTPSDDLFVLVKRTSIEFAAGSGNVANYTEIEPLMFREDWLRSKSTSVNNIELATVYGDSMEPYIWDGDVIAFDRGRGLDSLPVRRRNGSPAIFVFGIDTEEYCKELSRVNKKIDIISTNKEYKKRSVLVEEIRIYGRVIWSGHSWV